MVFHFNCLIIENINMNIANAIFNKSNKLFNKKTKFNI